MRANRIPETQVAHRGALANLVGRPCPMPPADWHRKHLNGGEQGNAPAARARRHHHTCMLAYIADPAGAERPLVSIVIPVYNRASMLIEAVQSCVAQTWRPIEIVVIDDGSDDDPASALRQFGDTVRLFRKANGGVASARNAGIAQARGEFIHLLDSDDLLQPDAIARKVAAFAAIPDAGLCFSMVSEHTQSGMRGAKIRPPDGRAACATSDLLVASIGRCPFYTTTIMMPRWVMMAAAPFEEAMRRGEDSRYLFKLGLAGIKAIGFDEALTIRRLVEGGLSALPREEIGIVEVRLRIVHDLIQAPSRWPLIAKLIRRLGDRLMKCTDLSPESVRDLPAFSQLTAAIAALGDGGYREGLSPLPLLASIRRGGARSGMPGDPRWGGLWRTLDRVIASALKSAATLTPQDIASWPGWRNPRDAHSADELLEATAQDSTLVRQIDRMLRRGYPSPTLRSIQRYRGLRRILRSGHLAGWLTWPAMLFGVYK